MANQSPLQRLLPALGVTALMFAAGLAQADDYDLVILNGRVMDPETNFDELRSGGVIIAHFTAQMAFKGRMQEGADADITTFDPEKVTDNSSLKQGKNALPSTGIPYVLVNGTIVVKDSRVLKDVFPGQAIRVPIRNQAATTLDS